MAAKKKAATQKRKKRPAKHKPPTKISTAATRKPKRASIKIEMPVEIPAANPKTFAYARELAGTYYACDLNGCSVADMSKLEKFQHLSPTTLQSWAEKDKWTEKRKAFRAKLAEKFEDKLAGQLVRHRFEQLQELKNQAEMAGAMLRTGALEPKSYEGVLSAWTRLQQFIDEQQMKLVDEIGPSPIEGNAPRTALPSPTLKPSITDDEAQAAAHAILKERLRQQREELAKSKG